MLILGGTAWLVADRQHICLVLKVPLSASLVSLDSTFTHTATVQKLGRTHTHLSFYKANKATVSLGS